MKIIHIIPLSIYGGAQRSVAQLAAAQRRLGVHAVVIGLYYNKRVAEDLESRQIPYYFTGNHANYDCRGWWRLLQAVGQVKPDIIHFHMTVI